jgi:hypothetical protein
MAGYERLRLGIRKKIGSCKSRERQRLVENGRLHQHQEGRKEEKSSFSCHSHYNHVHNARFRFVAVLRRE